MNSSLSKFSPSQIKIETEDDVVSIISSYFSSCEDNNEPPTYTELAMLLGLTRFQLKNFPEDHQFYKIIFKARQLVVAFAEKQLFLPKQSAGIQFWLKNNDDWVDKSTVEISKAKTMLEILNDIDSKNNNQPTIYEQSIPPTTDSDSQTSL